jgi:hypothetical protein
MENLVSLIKKNYMLRFEWDLKEFGLGWIIYKPIYRPFPRKNYWIGIAIRLLWFGIFIKIWDRMSVEMNQEIYDEKQRMKDISAFHNKELIAFKNLGSIDVYWQWNHFGTMIYYRAPNRISMPGCISIDILWFTISYDFSQKSLLN